MNDAKLCDSNAHFIEKDVFEKEVKNELPKMQIGFN